MGACWVGFTVVKIEAGSCIFCLSSPKKCKCLSWWLWLMLLVLIPLRLLLSCMPSFFLFKNVCGRLCAFLSYSCCCCCYFCSVSCTLFQIFQQFQRTPTPLAAVHFGLPQTQHALNFASYHNAAVKLITSLECKNEPQAPTKCSSSSSSSKAKATCPKSTHMVVSSYRFCSVYSSFI